MERMLIKHLSGSKANQVEEFSLKHHNELIFGRDLTATVRYDADRDDLVGRQHAKIARDPANPNGFLLTDLNSSNGTFLNQQRVYATVKLNPGDRVQFGPGGPEFTFDVEPRSTEQVKATRAVDSQAATIPSTRVVGVGAGFAGEAKSAGTVGKATVERMVSQAVADTKREQGRKFGLLGGITVGLILLLVVGALGGGYWYFNRVSGRTADLEKRTAGMAANEISAKYQKAVVYVEVTWHLMNKATQSPVYHAWTNTESGLAPLYVRLPSGRVEPVLRDSKSSEVDKQIGGNVRGTGFITKANGFILTSRSVAAPWKAVYNFPEKYTAGLLVDSTTGQPLDRSYRPAADPNWDWIPADSEQTQPQSLSLGSKKKKEIVKILAANNRDGKEDLIEVTLPGRDTPFRGQMVQISQAHNVAQLKIEATTELPVVDLFDSYETLSKGDQTTVIGYSDASAPIVGEIQSKDSSNPGTKMRIIPNPKVITGPISDIPRDTDTKKGGKTRSLMGDFFELSLAAVGIGASGSPIFDSQGRVIGIFVPGENPNEFYGVPIRYGKLLGGS